LDVAATEWSRSLDGMYACYVGWNVRNRCDVLVR
jgi:hypothetical protein